MKTKVSFIFIILYIAYLIFPIFQDFYRFPTGVLNIAIVVVLFLLNAQKYVSRVVFWAILYLTILFLYMISGKELPGLGIGDYESQRTLIVEAAKILTATSILLVVSETGALKQNYILVIVVLVLLSISYLFIIPQANADVNVLRKNEAYGINHVFGMPNYTLTHAYMLIVPPLLYGISVLKNKQRTILIGVLILTLLVILKSYVTTTLLLSFAAIIVSLIYQNNSRKTIFTIVGVSIFVFLLSASGVIEVMLKALSNVFVDTAVEGKFIDITAVISGENASVGVLDERSELHNMSWNVFFDNILIGGKGVGNHSYIIDRLAGLGLLGTIPFIAMLIASVKFVLKKLVTSKSRFYYSMTMIMVAIMMWQKGLFGEEAWVLMWGVVPSMFYVFQRSENIITNKHIVK